MEIKVREKRILGIDAGSNSLGWAIVDRNMSNHYTLVDKGVLIFQEGVKIEKGIESSKAAERTSHRSLRRQYFRRRLRKIEVLKALIKYNLCPALTEEDLKLWHSRKIYPKKDEFMLWQRTDDKQDINPYHSRYMCLTSSLDFNKQSDRYTLGRAIYHLAQRRGFMTNRLDANEDAESGAVKAGISELSVEIEKDGCQYLGEYFYHLFNKYGHRKRIRTRYVDREIHYKAEFHAICAKQNLSPEMKNDLERALYFQRPLKSQRQSVGKCTFEKTKPRCSDSHPLYEEFRMLSFINNVRIQGPDDTELRPLCQDEIKRILPLFYRVSKVNFDFEDIAKKIAGKNQYQHIKDPDERPYKFNYRMSQGVPGCPTIAQLKAVFGEDWMAGIAETYNKNCHKNGTPKTAEEMACDVWNVLYSFDSKEILKEWAISHLQLEAEQAEKFSKIKLSHDFASLSLKAIRNILPFLREGMIYSHAVFMGKIPSIVGSKVWDDEKERSFIMDQVNRMIQAPSDKVGEQQSTLDNCIKSILREKYQIEDDKLESLYHPSWIETYPEAKPNQEGVVLLGSPRTNAVRNPMAMRSLHEIRKVVNTLIKEGKIGPDTEVHVEYARTLNNANMRAAINDRQRELEKLHKKYAEALKQLYKEATQIDIEPTESDILKYQLWEEQNHICLYTGERIAISDFIGANPCYDIEHTIPRSVGGDSTQENMTLCSSRFNREIKKAMLPSQLGNHGEILERIIPWKEKVEELTKQIDRISTRGIWDKAEKDKRIRKKNALKMERDYWRGKYQRFIMTEVPEGFALRQGAGIGIISKYAALYLKSYFHDVSHPERRQVYSIKGAITAEFRKMWGIQSEYEKKSRDSHTHHCLDAIVIACIGKNEFNQMGQFFHDMYDYKEGKGQKPVFPKPWETFTQDLKKISNELLVVHDTPDNMPKNSCRWIETPHGKKKAKSDCARGRLHQDTYYGAIMQGNEKKYVVRRTLDANFKESDINNIVDDVVREKVRAAFVEHKLKQPVYMNQEKGIEIKKVRCFTPSVKNPLSIRQHRDVSRKEYKRQYHVMNETNYCLAIYEGVVKGKLKRDFELVNTLEAVSYYKRSADARMYPIVPEKSRNEFDLKYILHVGKHVLLYEKSREEIRELPSAEIGKRLYVITGLSISNKSDRGKIYPYGSVNLRHHAEARPGSELKAKGGPYKQGEELRPVISMYHTQLQALVEGIDFEITPLGEIKLRD